MYHFLPGNGIWMRVNVEPVVRFLLPLILIELGLPSFQFLLICWCFFKLIFQNLDNRWLKWINLVLQRSVPKIPKILGTVPKIYCYSQFLQEMNRWGSTLYITVLKACPNLNVYIYLNSGLSHCISRISRSTLAGVGICVES